MKKLLAGSLTALVLAVTLAACGGSSASSSTTASAAPASASMAAGTPAPSNLVETAVAAGQFKTLVSLVKQAGLAGALTDPGPLTVLAPTDAAFAKVPKATLTALAHNQAKLKAVLLYHVVKGDVTAAQVVKLKSAKTLEGGSLPIHASAGKVYVGDAQVIKPDVRASNGVIHVINQVLIPAS